MIEMIHLTSEWLHIAMLEYYVLRYALYVSNFSRLI